MDSMTNMLQQAVAQRMNGLGIGQGPSAGFHHIVSGGPIGDPSMGFHHIGGIPLNQRPQAGAFRRSFQQRLGQPQPRPDIQFNDNSSGGW